MWQWRCHFITSPMGKDSDTIFISSIFKFLKAVYVASIVTKIIVIMIISIIIYHFVSVTFKVISFLCYCHLQYQHSQCFLWLLLVLILHDLVLDISKFHPQIRENRLSLKLKPYWISASMKMKKRSKWTRELKVVVTHTHARTHTHTHTHTHTYTFALMKLFTIDFDHGLATGCPKTVSKSVLTYHHFNHTRSKEVERRVNSLWPIVTISGVIELGHHRFNCYQTII